MKSAALIIDVSRKINAFDYISKIKPLMDNMDHYDVVYCLLNDLAVNDANYLIYDKKSLIKDNVQTLINLGLDKKVEYVLQSKIEGLFELSNELSKYIYISKIIKNDFLKTSIQKNSLNDIKLSTLINVANIFSSIILLNVNDLYETRNFESLSELVKKVLFNYNEANDNKLFWPNIMINQDIYCNNLSADGNSFISEKFDNDISLDLVGEELQAKINGIFTDPNHIRVQDKGTVEGNPLFAFVDAICSDADVKEFFGLDSIEKLKDNYIEGGIGDFKIKKMLYSAFLKKFECCSSKINADEIYSRLNVKI